MTPLVRLAARVILAELVKFQGLPAIVATELATLGSSIALAAAVAGSSAGTGLAGVVQRSVAPLQFGPILIGILAAACEYQGRQIHTSLIATPNRLLLLTGKILAYLIAATVTSAAAIAAGLTTAWVTLHARHRHSHGHLDARPVAGCLSYLVLIGLLSLAVTLLLRSLTASLATMLTLTLVASPLLAATTPQARWLPDRAGSTIYLTNTHTPLTAAEGALVLLAWIVVTTASATVAFSRRDP